MILKKIYAHALGSRVQSLLILLMLGLATASAYSDVNIDNSPCKLGSQTSDECEEFVSTLNGEDLDKLASQLAYRNTYRVPPTKVAENEKLRWRWMELAAEKGHLFAILDLAHHHEGYGRLEEAEELHRLALSKGYKRSEQHLRSLQGTKSRRYIENAAFLIILLLLNYPVMIKRTWSSLRRQTLIMLPYYSIMLMYAWLTSSGSGGGGRHPILRVVSDLVDPLAFFLVFIVVTPIAVVLTNVRLVRQGRLQKKFAVLNILVISLVVASVLFLGYIFS